MSVPQPVAVKKAGTPAPPALIRSASVPCRQQSTMGEQNLPDWIFFLNNGTYNSFSIHILGNKLAIENKGKVFILKVWVKDGLTCGVNSTSSSPQRYCLSNSTFSPTYDEIIRLICLVRRSRPRPKSSTLFKTYRRSNTIAKYDLLQYISTNSVHTVHNYFLLSLYSKTTSRCRVVTFLHHCKK